MNTAAFNLMTSPHSGGMEGSSVYSTRAELEKGARGLEDWKQHDAARHQEKIDRFKAEEAAQLERSQKGRAEEEARRRVNEVHSMLEANPMKLPEHQAVTPTVTPEQERIMAVVQPQEVVTQTHQDQAG